MLVLHSWRCILVFVECKKASKICLGAVKNPLRIFQIFLELFLFSFELILFIRRL
jgi:hypothetical protein